jgi:hypothetical protein
MNELPVAPPMRITVTPAQAEASLAAQQTVEDNQELAEALRCEHCFLLHPGVLCWSFMDVSFYESGAIKHIVYSQDRHDHVKSLALDTLDDVPSVQ